MPTLADVLLRSLSVRGALNVVAGACLLPALLTPFVAWSEFAPQGAGTIGEAVRSHHVWFAGIAFALYAPIEFCLSTWATTYLTDLGYQERRAAWMLSAFWFAFLGGRVVMAIIESGRGLPHGAEPWLILMLALLVTVALGNLIGAASRKQAAWGLVGLGFMLGPIFPLLVGIVFEDVSPVQRGTAYGTMFAIGSMGSFVLAPLIGMRARRQTVQQALRVPLVISLLLVCVSLVLALV